MIFDFVAEEEGVNRRKLKEHRVNAEWCKGCGICVAFCAKKVLEMDMMDKAVVVRPDACVACGLCEIRCPDLAIEMVFEEEPEDIA